MNVWNAANALVATRAAVGFESLMGKVPSYLKLAETMSKRSVGVVLRHFPPNVRTSHCVEARFFGDLSIFRMHVSMGEASFFYAIRTDCSLGMFMF